MVGTITLIIPVSRNYGFGACLFLIRYRTYTTALFILSPLATKGINLVTLETRAIRHSWAALVLGAFLQTFLDIIIDPVALQGSHWFLGQIYGYYEEGVHFGVPLSNYIGWLLTSFFLVAVFNKLTESMI